MSGVEAPLGSLSNPLPRRAARILLINGSGRLLLWRGYDPARPQHRYWFTVGGGLDAGETPAQGAVRELREETGLAVEPGALGDPVWQQTTEFPFDGQWYRQEQVFFVVRVDNLAVDDSGFDEIERRSIDDHRWWSVDQLSATAERFYPAELPALMREILEA